MERITNRKWLQNEKNLLGKTLCIIGRGFSGVDPKTKEHTIRFSETNYVIDITKVEPDINKTVDYIYGEYCIYLENTPPLLEKEDIPTIGTLDCAIIDYFNPGEFERYEYYVMSREEAIEQIKEHNRKIIGNLYNI